MRSKTPLALMEQLIMVLVFALAAALCMRAFVLSDGMSRAMEERDRALPALQTVAETLKLCRGDLSRTEETAEAVLDNVDIVLYHDGEWENIGSDTLRIGILPTESSSDLMGCAEITAVNREGEAILSLTVAWQEVDGDE